MEIDALKIAKEYAREHAKILSAMQGSEMGINTFTSSGGRHGGINSGYSNSSK